MRDNHQSWRGTCNFHDLCNGLTSRRPLPLAVSPFNTCYTHCPTELEERYASSPYDRGWQTSKTIGDPNDRFVPTVVSARLLELPEEVLDARGSILDKDQSVTPVI